MMQATFLAHSGFLVELDSVTLLFDWWKGTLPPLPQDKPRLVFASHRHEDHFNPAIFALAEDGRDIQFLLSHDIRLTERNRAKWRISEAVAQMCSCLRGGETVRPLPNITVETLSSTDEGVAFLVTAHGQTVYHAGDLHWWHWEGEDKGWNRNMEVNFKRYIEPLRGRAIDLAMAPLDPRLEKSYAWGLEYFLTLAQVRSVLPMHQWGDYALTERFCREYPHLAGPIVPIVREGQSVTF